MELFWQFNHAKDEWELRTPPSALILKLKYNQHDNYRVYCLGESYDFKEMHEISAKRFAVRWMVSVVEKLKHSLEELYDS